MIHYRDIVLHFETTSSREVVVRVLDSPAGEGAAAVGQSLSAAESIGILAALTVGSSEVSRETTEMVGDRLFAGLFSGEVGALFERSLGLIAGRRDEALRIVLRLDLSNRELAFLYKLPWELLYRRSTGEFLALDRSISVVRRLAVARPGVWEPVSGPLRILLVVSEPAGMPQLDLQAEREAIESSLGATEDFVVTVLTKPTPEALRAKLLSDKFHIVHFMGHGAFNAETGEGALVLEDMEGNALRVGGAEVAATLSGAESVRVAFLNACDTAKATAEDRANPFAGVAAAMVRGGVPVVVAMQFPITDMGAAKFSATFYRRLAQGDVVEAAVTEGRVALYTMGGARAEWFAPALFARAAGDVVLGQKGRKAAVGEEDSEQAQESGPNREARPGVKGDQGTGTPGQDKGKGRRTKPPPSGQGLREDGGSDAAVSSTTANKGEAPSLDKEGGRRTKPSSAEEDLTDDGDIGVAEGSAFDGIQSYTASVLRQVEISDEEARKEHRTWSKASLVAAGVGFGRVIAALVSALLSQREVGVVTGIASVVSGAVSALFFKQSQAASARLVRMTDDLAELRNISMAQHIAQTMETALERDKAKAGIVEALLSSPGVGAHKKGRGKKI